MLSFVFVYDDSSISERQNEQNKTMNDKVQFYKHTKELSI